MKDLYEIDLETLQLEYLQHRLENEDLTPGRKILQEEITERFAVLKSLGIYNLQDLTDVLKTQKKIEKFAVQSGLPQHYLTVLRREANGYKPKAFPLGKIPGVDELQIQKLAKVGIKNTKQLFERACSLEARRQLADEAGIPVGDVLELVKMADLARVYGVGPVFVRILLDAKVESTAELALKKPEALLEEVIAVNQEKGYTKIMPNLHDMQVCVEFASLLPAVLEV